MQSISKAEDKAKAGFEKPLLGRDLLRNSALRDGSRRRQGAPVQGIDSRR
jgi:hypothetical protein